MRVSVSGRVVLIGAAVVVVVAAVVVGLVVAIGGGGDRARAPLATPRYTADPVPKARVLHAGDLPHACGVRSATVRRYAPAGDPELHATRCHWYSLNGGHEHCAFCPAAGGDRERVLDVSIETGRDKSGNGAAPAADALRVLNPAPVALVESGHRPRTVGGLGDEALYYYSPAARGSAALGAFGARPGASLVFRVGAAVVTVGYDGRDWTGDDGPVRQVTEKEARPAVLAVASDVARSLRVPAKPAFTRPRRAAGAPVRRIPRPCDLVPAAVVDRLAKGAERRRIPAMPGNRPDTPYGLAAVTCRWDARPTCCLGEATDHRPERHIAVTVSSVARWRRGIAVPPAARQYLERHYDARDGGSAHWFRALRGLGDQAFAAYADDTSMVADEPVGTVVFRHRNLLVEVGYWGDDDRPLPRAQAVTGAYTVAARARAALPG